VRTIKFRCWSTKRNPKMVYLPEDGSYSGRDLIGDSDWAVMQFTGLLDKNGKEIYEGDIVRILYTDWMSKSDADPRTLEQYKIDISRVGVVEYFYDRFNLYFPNRGGVTTGSLSEGDHGEKEIIGNIYENPELLTKGETK
jgi:uncharacterized phage protein (TIGR01671 family)